MTEKYLPPPIGFRKAAFGSLLRTQVYAAPGMTTDRKEHQMEGINLSATPYSCYGSYLSVIREEGAGFAVGSLHGIAQGSGRSCSLTFEKEGRELPLVYECDGGKVRIFAENEEAELCFLSENQLLLSSSLPGTDLLIDTHPLFDCEQVVTVAAQGGGLCAEINSYKNKSKYLVRILRGEMEISQNFSGGAASNHPISGYFSKIRVRGGEDGLAVLICDVAENAEEIPCFPAKQEIETRMSVSKAGQEPEGWLASSGQSLPSWQRKFEALVRCQDADGMKKTVDLAVYILWSSAVRASGFLKRDIIYSSNRDFPGIWSWDNGFIAAAVAPLFPDLAADELSVFFDYASEYGQIPDSVSDTFVGWNYCKPPVTGWFLRNMEEHGTLQLTEEQRRFIYKGLSGQVNFYYRFKDMNGDGICEYRHGNDSGQDNSTSFDVQAAIDSPDLSAWLICSEDWLADAAVRLHLPDQADMWKRKADFHTEKFHRYFIPALAETGEADFVPGIAEKEEAGFWQEPGAGDIRTESQSAWLPCPRRSMDGTWIRQKSLLPVISLILGNRLEEKVRDALTEEIEKHFLTEWGVATERPDSPSYMSDGYWRGPIWAPTTYLIEQSLRKLGRTNTADMIRDRFIDLVRQHGFYENFDALTGKGNRDPSFCWTAAVFLCFAEQKVRR